MAKERTKPKYSSMASMIDKLGIKAPPTGEAEIDWLPEKFFSAPVFNHNTNVNLNNTDNQTISSTIQQSI